MVMPATNDRLQKWMEKHGKTDADLAAALGISRVQANRIKRGVSYASVKTAMRLYQLTRISWKHFHRDGHTS